MLSAFKNSLDIYKEIISMSADMILFLDTSYCIRAANAAYAAHHNTTIEKILGLHLKAVTGDDFFNFVIKELIDRSFQGETVLKRSGSNPENIEKEFFYDVTIKPYFEAEGVVGGCIIVIHDITEQEKAIEALEHLKFLNDEAQKILKIGSWELDIVKDTLWWSDEIYRIFNIDKEVFRASYEAFLAAVHPEDRNMVNTAYTDSLKTKKPYDIVHRLLLPDGSIKFVREKCYNDFDDAGNPLRSIGTVHDISAEYEMVQKLQQSATIIEHTVESIMITDAQNRIVSINPAFEKMTGYALEEIQGKKPSLLKSKRHNQSFYKKMWDALKETGSWHGEIWNRRKNGEVYPEWRTISVIKNKEGEVVNYVGIASDISELKESRDELAYLSQYDALTNLPNRMLLQARLQHSIDVAMRSKKIIAVCFLDIDNFKNINDTFGHDLGDLILKETALRLSRNLRSDDTLSRFGGDEFIIVLNGINDTSEIVSIVKKLLNVFDMPFDINNTLHHLSASIGISLYPNDSNKVDELIKYADAAMYLAKEGGKNGYAFYTQEITQNIFEKMLIESNLREALKEEQFELYYQPQIDVISGEIMGVEALIRWKHPQLGIVSPAKFIPSAEESRLIIPMGQWVLQTACLQTKKWHEKGLFKGRVAVNISGIEFEQSDFMQKTIQTIQNSGIEPKYVELEITESSLMVDPNKWLETLNALGKIGVTLSIDDFGTGYSSLSYLRKLPVHTLKIDQSFVADLPDEAAACSIANAVISLAKSMNMTALAEGIENQEQFEYLKVNGCDIAQGYYFSRPLSVDDFETMLAEKKI